ncbi:MAG TPA: helix-turn-helix transcriptional regulator [Acidimicrobiales bacterium]|nr:helix-turn-helix transcriptional regulator [Acidimicrobiales bacterium]
MATPPTLAGQILTLARHERGLSQRQLAERAGVSQSEIARIETGQREPSIPTIDRILAGAGIELRFRLVRVEDTNPALPADETPRVRVQRGRPIPPPSRQRRG